MVQLTSPALASTVTLVQLSPAIVTLALQINENRGWITDEQFKAATDAGVTQTEILETVAVVTLNLLTNYLNHVIGTEVDFPKVDLVETVNA